jgi:hypothetical protein
VVASPLMTTNRIRINILAAGARLPTMHGQSDNVEAGGLMSYGAASAGRASGGEKLAEWEIRAPQERGPSVKHFGGEVVIRPETILA